MTLFDLWRLDPATRRRIAAIVLLAVPATVLLSFAIGEMVAGDLSGSQHLPEGGVLLVLVGVGWCYPRLRARSCSWEERHSSEFGWCSCCAPESRI